MKIYIFRVSKYWQWCNGGLVAKAENWKDLEDVVKLYAHGKSIEEKYECNYTLKKEEPILTANSNGSFEDKDGLWILVESYELEGEQKKGVVLCEYNEG